MDDVTWQALALVLTAAGGWWTYHAFRTRGLASGLRGAGLTLLPAAAYLTGTLELGAEITSAVADWGAGLVFSPRVWVGLILLATSAMLLFVAGVIKARTTEPGQTKEPKRPKQPRQVEKGAPPAPVIDDELAEIEAILKKRGIS